GQREFLNAKPPLHRPITAGGDDELHAVGHLGPGIEATVLQDEPLPPGSIPVPPGQRRIVRRIAMVDEETPAGPKRPRHATQDRLVLAEREVPEAREEADHGVELRRVAESPHVAVHEPQSRSLAETAPGLVEHRAREIQANHMEAAPAELGSVASIAARHVEDPRTPRRRQPPHTKTHPPAA